MDCMASVSRWFNSDECDFVCADNIMNQMMTLPYVNYITPSSDHTIYFFTL